MNPPPSQSRLRLACETTLVCALLLLHAWMALSACVGKGAAIDEMLHLTAGHACWSDSAVHLMPESGMLPQRWVALPAVLGGVEPPSPGSFSWKNSQVMSLSYEYFYFGSAHPDMLLFNARAWTLAWSLGCGLLVWAWARRLWGTAGGLFSLVLFCFSPEFLAHGALATTDACSSFWLLASVGAFWRHLRRDTPGSLLLSALCFGLACVSKFNAVLLPVVWLLCLAAHWLAAPPVTGSRRLRQLATLALVHALVAALIIWAFFGFSNQPGAGFVANQFPWSYIRDRIGWKADLLEGFSHAGLLPTQYVYGFAHMLAQAKLRGAFLLGECSSTGWWYFFPVSFLAKSTLALLAGLLLLGLQKLPALARRVRNGGAHWLQGGLLESAPLLAFLAVFWASSLLVGLNIGHRHILPTYAPLYILVAAPAAWLLQSQGLKGRLLACLLLLSQVAESLSIRPNYLAYFNPLWGGPGRGYQILVDSSLDWGQDLPALADWLDAQGWHQGRAIPCNIAYFGTGYLQRDLPGAGTLLSLPSIESDNLVVRLRPGFYCVSATMLQQAYQQPRDWTTQMEATYQACRRNEAGHPVISPLHAELRFRRLCAWLRSGKPDTILRHSLLIYRLSAGDLQRALDGPYSVWQEGRAPAPKTR